MIRARVLLFLCFFPAACHRPVPVKQNPPARRAPPVVAQDTLRTQQLGAPHAYDFRTPDQTDSLRAVVRRERALWRATSPKDYRFLLKVGCFCPGTRGWLVMEVRSGQPLRAFDAAGKPVPLTDWNTLSVDGLFDNLERSAERRGQVQFDFDPQWHFPTYVYTSVFPGPDMWGVVEARGLKPLAP